MWFPPAIRDTSSAFNGFMCLPSPARVQTLHRQLLAFDSRRARDDFGMLFFVDRAMLAECVAYLRDATATDQALAVFYA